MTADTAPAARVLSALLIALASPAESASASRECDVPLYRVLPGPDDVVVSADPRFVVAAFYDEPRWPHERDVFPRSLFDMRFQVRRTGSSEDIRASNPTSYHAYNYGAGRFLLVNPGRALDADTSYELVAQRKLDLWPGERVTWVDATRPPPPPRWVLDRLEAMALHKAPSARFVAVVPVGGQAHALENVFEAEVVIRRFRTSSVRDAEPPRWTAPQGAAVVAEYHPRPGRGSCGPRGPEVVMPVGDWADLSIEPAGVAVMLAGPVEALPGLERTNGLLDFVAAFPLDQGQTTVSLSDPGEACPNRTWRDVKQLRKGRWWVRLLDAAGNFSEPRRLRLRDVGPWK